MDKNNFHVKIIHLREKIDQIDQHLLTLLNQRLLVAKEIGQLKHQLNQPVRNTAREKELLETLCHSNKGPIPAENLKQIFSEIILASIHLQEEQDE